MIVNYLVNGRPFYMFMALNSMKMLRQYNSDIPVRLLFIEGETINRPEAGCYISTEDFFEECANLSVEVLSKPWRDEEESFFLTNKAYLAQQEDRHVLFIDVDTFIFGDVAPLCEKYGDVDVAGCCNRWVLNDRGWNNQFLTSSRDVAPFNGGVLLFNNGWLQDRGEQWCDLIRGIRVGTAPRLRPIHEWLVGIDRLWCREEMALSAMIADSDASYAYFDQEDVHNVYWPSDLHELDKSVIAHTYTDNWKQAYNILRGSTTKKKFRPKLLRR